MKLTKQGVRDLNGDWKASQETIVPAPQRVEVEIDSDEEKQQIDDLLYDDTKELREEILALWPDAKLERDYDDIHEGRLGVCIPKATKRSWFSFLMRSGYASISFYFQLSLRTAATMPLIEGT